ncbi:MAG TPA: hypothetical protein VKQ28_10860 [Candidatus Acidoferrum sp.]|nr:hypothetical protein [Candidatus Acidoferrum sp.]
MSEELCEAGIKEDDAVPRSRAITRLMVLPFRMLRHHESSDFLAVGLPDAITSSLWGIDSVIVRSTLVASRLTVGAEIAFKRTGIRRYVMLQEAMLTRG